MLLDKKFCNIPIVGDVYVITFFQHAKMLAVDDKLKYYAYQI